MKTRGLIIPINLVFWINAGSTKHTNIKTITKIKPFIYIKGFYGILNSLYTIFTIRFEIRRYNDVSVTSSLSIARLPRPLSFHIQYSGLLCVRISYDNNPSFRPTRNRVNTVYLLRDNIKRIFDDLRHGFIRRCDIAICWDCLCRGH